MDRERALELLRGGQSGVEQWNRARESDPSLPVLAEANLSRRDLTDANLQGLSLRGAFLGGSQLDRADLSDAKLCGADFQACRLCRATLCRSDLRNANLRSADVAGADLTDADLRGATLIGVRMPLATLRVVGPDDMRSSMQRVDKLPLADEARQSLLEILQKLDMMESLSRREKQEAATHLDELIKVMLQTPNDPRRLSELVAVLTGAESPLAAEISEEALLSLRLPVST
jgi:uncharacterized protein YjbI with pentapeptide repeats